MLNMPGHSREASGLFKGEIVSQIINQKLHNEKNVRQMFIETKYSISFDSSYI